MNQVFLLTNEKSWKSLLVEDDRLLLISSSYSTPAEFLEGYHDEGIKRLLKTKKEILIGGISGMKHPQEGNTLHLFGLSEETLEFSNEQEMEAVAQYLSKKRGFQSQTESMSFWNSIKSPAIGLVLIFIFGFVLYMDAKKLEGGGTVDTGGRRAWVKQIIASVAGFLGVTGSILVTVAAALVCFYLIWRRIKTPPNEVVYN